MIGKQVSKRPASLLPVLLVTLFFILTPMKEIFKPIPDYEDYEVSNMGCVVSLKAGKRRILKQSVTYDGYCKLNLWSGGICKTKKVHRLVILTFKGDSDLVVNHKNGIKTDNRLLNLEYCTQRQNSQHYRKNVKSTSKYVGVCWNKRNEKWQSEIKINKKNIYIGLFKTEIEAAEAYKKALNNINETMYKPR